MSMENKDFFIVAVVSFMLGGLTTTLVVFVLAMISYEWAGMAASGGIVLVAMFTFFWYLLIRNVIVRTDGG